MASIYDFLQPGAREQAGYAGLMQLASGLMQGGAPSAQPGGAMRGLGLGLGGFNQGYQGSINSAAQMGMLGSQMAKAKRDADADEAWKALITPKPAGLQYAMANGTGSARPGPTVGAAAQMGAETNPLLASLPAPVAAMLPGMDRTTGASLLGQVLTKDSTPVVLPQGAELRSRGGQLLATGQPKDDETTKLMRLAGIDPQSEQGKSLALEIIKRKGMSPTTTINTAVDMAAEKEENKGFGQSLIKEWDSIRERANASQDAINQLSIARGIKAPAGALEPAKAKVGAVGQALGFSPQTLSMFGLDRATDAQAYTGIMQNLVLTKMQAQKGPQTENDAKRIEATLASISNTEQAQDFLMRSAMALSRRDVEQRQFFEEWQDKKGTFKGAAAAWRDHIGKTPLVGVSPNTRLPVFFEEFAEANRGKPRDQIMEAWRQRYGG